MDHNHNHNVMLVRFVRLVRLATRTRFVRADRAGDRLAV